MSDPFAAASAISPSTTIPLGGLKEDDLNSLQAKTEETKSKAKLNNALAHDQEALTKLKGDFAAGIMIFLWFWFGALVLFILTYYTHQMTLGKEIPKEVIISAFTCTAVVVGLVGYILKGLFGSK